VTLRRSWMTSILPLRRRFLPPWTVDEYNAACFIVRDHNRQSLAYICYDWRRRELRIQRRDQTFLPGLSLKLPDAEPDGSQTRAGGDEQTGHEARSLRAAAEAPLFGLVIVLQRNHQSLHRPQRPQCDN
jgi:hypothetical protein